MVPPEQDMERWGSSKVPGRNDTAWRPNAPAGRGAVGRGNEWNARRGRATVPQASVKGTPPPGFDGPPGFPTKPVSCQFLPHLYVLIGQRQLACHAVQH